MPYYPSMSQVIMGKGGLKLDPDGKIGIFDAADGTQIVVLYAGAYTTPPTNPAAIIRRTSNLILDPPNLGSMFLGFNQAAALQFKNAAGPTIDLGKLPLGASAPWPLPVIYAMDNRAGVTAADGSPITLLAVPAGANQLYRVSLEIVATAFTSGTATYTVTWTENAVTQTAVVTATAINVVTGVVRLMMPDPSTNITVQLTGVFTATVRISSLVEEMAAP